MPRSKGVRAGAGRPRSVSVRVLWLDWLSPHLPADRRRSVALALLFSCLRADTQDHAANTVLLKRTIITVDPEHSIAQAAGMRGRRIVFVGSTSAARKYVGDTRKVIGLAGRTATPGLIDTNATCPSQRTRWTLATRAAWTT